MQEVWIDKLDVARRQIKAAVRLYFREDDPVVIHTVVAAAHQVLFDIGKGEGVTGAIKNSNKLKPEEIQGYIRSINYPFNFFKHADRDSDNRINIGPLLRFTQDFLMDAIVMLQGLTSEIPIEAKVYWTWFVAKYPKDFEDVPRDGAIRRLQKLRLADWKLEDIDQFLSYSNFLGPDMPLVEGKKDGPNEISKRVGCWGWVKALFQRS